LRGMTLELEENVIFLSLIDILLNSFKG